MNDRARHRSMLAVLVSAALLGCAPHRPASIPATAPSVLSTTAPTTMAAVNDRMEMPLDQIPPRPAFPDPATRPSAQPSLEAVQLFARARIAALDGQFQTAINLLEKAVNLDPASYELRFTLARLYQGDKGSDERSIAALEKATALEPDHLAAQLSLGRQYLDRGRTAAGIEHLRLALKTRDYRQEGPDAAIADYFLAHALQQEGYDASAVMLYRRLAVRLRNPGLAFRASPELALLADQPDALRLQIGQLQQKRGRYAEALEALEPAASADPANFELQSRIVKLRAASGDIGKAEASAGELVVQRHADAESVNLLRELLRARNAESTLPDVLGQLYREHRNQRPILYAQIDALRQEGRAVDAQRVLASAAGEMPDNFEIVRRQFDLLLASGERTGATELLIETVAKHPDWSGEATDLFSQLVRPSSQQRLRLDELRRLQVQNGAEASRQFWVSRVAGYWHHDGESHAALELAVKARPVFAPAWREWMDELGADTGLSENQKAAAENSTASDADKAGDKALAFELQGLAFLRRQQPQEAVRRFADAVRAGGRSPDLRRAQGVALKLSGDGAGFESMMWRLISDHPETRDGYLNLYGYYLARGADNQAARVLSTWLENNPDSVDARRLQAREYFHSGRRSAAESILLRLYHEHPDDPEVLESLGAIYQATERIDEFITLLRGRLDHHPHDFLIVTELASLYQTVHRGPDATRLLDAARADADDDPDLLYRIAGMYARNGQKEASRTVLRRVLMLDPRHAGANNDLGYFLSQEGEHLSEAEVLIRRAVACEPHNVSFLDSLGWVLYKRGQFENARHYLDQAAGAVPDPDPVVLDHLGDVLYQLQDQARADQCWQRAAGRAQKLSDAGSEDEELEPLRAQLKVKHQQLLGHRPVEVSPVTEHPQKRAAKQ